MKLFNIGHIYKLSSQKKRKQLDGQCVFLYGQSYKTSLRKDTIRQLMCFLYGQSYKTSLRKGLSYRLVYDARPIWILPVITCKTSVIHI